MIVTLYGRQGCHLCDEAREALLEIAGEGAGLELREVDIESDAALHRAYLERIPVIVAQGAIVSELDFDRDELRRLFILSPRERSRAQRTHRGGGRDCRRRTG